jgi:hypothetical protein
MTKQKLLRVLNAHSGEHLTFAVREVCESRWLGAVSLWARIKQLFTGPVSVSRVGEVEVAVIVARGYEVTQAETDAYADAAKRVMPAGVKVSFVEFHK